LARIGYGGTAMNALGQRGVALAIVLWFLAGMSLLVSGIVYQARIDTRMAQLHLARATAVSAGDGAILLMLADVVSRDSQNATRKELLSGSFTVGRQTVAVELVPVSGLINLKTASAGTLAKLFVTRGHLTNGQAQILADNMLKWRDTPSGALPGAAGGQLQSPEDILHVAGMSRALWDSIRDVVVVNRSGSGDVPDLVAAPEAVRAVFGERAREDGANPAVPAESGTSYRVDAVVNYGGRAWLRRRWVDLGGVRANQLPWSFSRIEAPRVLSGDGSSK
jgi:general secretion pathway protein K